MESIEKVSFLINDAWFDFVFLPERSIWVGITPLTNLQCNIILQHAQESIKLLNLPSELNNPKQPRTMISWCESAQLCNALSKLVGFPPAYDATTFEQISHPVGFHLPVWEDWLLSCFAGDQPDEQSRFPWGSDPDLRVEYAVTSDDSLRYPDLVATRMPNRIGLYDLLGLVHEWGIDVDEQEEPDGKPFRQLFGGSYEDKLLEPTEGEVGAWPETTRQPTIGLRLYIDDSSQFRSLHQAVIEPPLSSTAMPEEINVFPDRPTMTTEALNSRSTENTVNVSPSMADFAKPMSGSDLHDVVDLWALIHPDVSDGRSLIESVLAFTLIPFDLVIANRGAGSSWLERWCELRRALHSRLPEGVHLLQLQESKLELETELIEFTNVAAARNNNIQPWDGKITNLQNYLPSDEIVGNAAFDDNYFSNSVVLNKELQFLLKNYTAMRSAFGAIMKDAGLIGAAIITGWLTDTKLEPADPDITITLEEGCNYSVATLADCLAGLKELEASLTFLSSRTSTESRLTPALARQMWVTLPGRLLETLERAASSIKGSDEASKQFVDLCRACIDGLKALLQSGNTDTSQDEDVRKQETQPLPTEVKLLEILAPLIPGDLLPVHIFRHRANLEPVEESKDLERELGEWERTLSDRERVLRDSFAEASKIAEEAKDVQSVRNEVEHLLNLLDWFHVLLEGGGRMPPALDYIDELVLWSPELTTAYRDNLLACWHLYQIEDQATKTQKVLERLIGTLSCKDHLNLLPPTAPTSEFEVAVFHLLEVARTSERNGTGYLSDISEAWRNLEHAYEQTPNTIPSLNPLEFFVSRQSIATSSESDDEE